MFNEAKEKFNDIFNNKLEAEEVKKYLVELYNRGESSEEIAAAALTMREHLIPLNIDNSLKNKLIDNCGTGGDKSNSFNISTTVSILLSACGSIVAKHGNRSITSNSGSADMLEALGVNLTLTPEQQVKMLEKTGFVFMFAINHHPAMKHIMPIRKSLNHRTIFNILGPLSNPAFVNKQLIGVFDKNYILPIAKALISLKADRVMVVSSEDGMDEISISDITHCAFINNGEIEEFTINPEDYGFKIAPKVDIEGGDAKFNAEITKNILNGTTQDAKKDIVILNTAAALFVDRKVDSIKEGIELAEKVINNGDAMKKLEEIIKVSNEI
jgi:anthranilate phosphoribosyltransferase